MQVDLEQKSHLDEQCGCGAALNESTWLLKTHHQDEWTWRAEMLLDVDCHWSSYFLSTRLMLR